MAPNECREPRARSFGARATTARSSSIVAGRCSRAGGYSWLPPQLRISVADALEVEAVRRRRHPGGRPRRARQQCHEVVERPPAAADLEHVPTSTRTML